MDWYFCHEDDVPIKYLHICHRLKKPLPPASGVNCLWSLFVAWDVQPWHRRGGGAHFRLLSTHIDWWFFVKIKHGNLRLFISLRSLITTDVGLTFDERFQLFVFIQNRCISFSICQSEQVPNKVSQILLNLLRAPLCNDTQINWWWIGKLIRYDSRWNVLLN